MFLHYLTPPFNYWSLVGNKGQPKSEVKQQTIRAIRRQMQGIEAELVKCEDECELNHPETGSFACLQNCKWNYGKEWIELRDMYQTVDVFNPPTCSGSRMDHYSSLNSGGPRDKEQINKISPKII
jgi:hypothetical protein